MQGQHEAAVSADAIQTGVTHNETYETLAADIHGFGAVHKCTDETCVRCGRSTTGPSLEGTLRAGDVRPDEGHPDPEIDHPRNNPKIAAGNVTEILEGVDDDTDHICDLADCARCNRIDDRALRPGYTIAKGGGGSGGKRGDKMPKKVCQVVGCGMTLCEHVRGGEGDSKRTGRPATGGRSKPVTYKISADAKAALKDGGVDGALIDELGFAIKNGLTIAKVRELTASYKKEAA